MNKIKLKIIDKRIGKDFPLPKYQTEGSAGIDLLAMLKEENIVVKANETVLIPTGISVFIDDSNYAAVIVPRSGLGHKHGIILGNSIGLIDSDYQGELFVSVWNRSKVDYEIKLADRIAQLVFLPVCKAEFDVVESFDSSERGEKGFGSTGKNN